MIEEKGNIPTNKRERNKIIKNHLQRLITIKLDTNTKGINTDKPVFVQRIQTIGFSVYIKIAHNKFVKRSNITEMADENGNILWKKQNN